MIVFKDAQLIREGNILLNQASATIYPQKKVGLVGKNGCGKSSLLSLIEGRSQLDSGDYSHPINWNIASIAQDISEQDLKKHILDYVIDGDSIYRDLEQQLQIAEKNNNALAIAQLHEKIDAIDGYTIESRAATLLAGLSFTQEQLRQPVQSLSGGWRVRANLARALICRSDLLLLDEPTNHLDLDALIWLEGWLNNYTGTLILISHDRDFLDHVVEQIIHIDHQQLVSYQGNYSTFERTKQEKIKQQQALYEKQVQQQAHLQKFIDRFRAKASKAKQVQSRIKTLDKLAAVAAAQVDSPFNFEFLAPEKLPQPLLKMEDITVGYEQTIILEKITLNLVPGARIGLLGRNGAGKSTFMKLLAGTIKPLSGVYETYHGVKIGYFAQHQLETLTEHASPLEHMQMIAPQQNEQALRDYLGRYGFQGDQALQTIQNFSGGEKARLVLALIIWQRPNLLLLDEPTNHLDLEMRHALTLALQEFTGAMLVVSHDRYLLQATCDTFYLVDDQKVQPFEGNLDDYHQWLLQKKHENHDTKPVKELDKKRNKRLEAERRQQLSPLKKQMKSIEKNMDQLQKKLQLIEQRLSESNIYESQNKSKLAKLLQEQQQCKQEQESLELTWFDLEEQIENLQQP